MTINPQFKDRTLVEIVLNTVGSLTEKNEIRSFYDELVQYANEPIWSVYRQWGATPERIVNDAIGSVLVGCYQSEAIKVWTDALPQIFPYVQMKLRRKLESRVNPDYPKFQSALKELLKKSKRHKRDII